MRLRSSICTLSTVISCTILQKPILDSRHSISAGVMDGCRCRVDRETSALGEDLPTSCSSMKRLSESVKYSCMKVLSVKGSQEAPRESGEKESDGFGALAVGLGHPP